MIFSWHTFPVFVSLVLLLHSGVAEAADRPLVWLGAVTGSSFTLHADITADVSAVVLSTSPAFDPVVATLDPNTANASVGDPAVYGRLRRLVFTSLSPSTRYHVGAKAGDAAPVPLASVRTYPPEGDASDVTIALGSCQLRPGWDVALQSIRKRFERHAERSDAPYLMLHMGDLHYSNIATDDVPRFERATRAALTAPRAHALFRALPVSYVYDDHDFGPNNADSSTPSRLAADANYRAMVPTPELAGSESAYHAFTVGRVRIIVSDTRYFAGETAGSTLGPAQRAWLDGELGRAGRYAAVVWLSSKPWIGRAEAGGDAWGGFAGERASIGARVAAQNVTNLVMVSGDAHMLAADDGSHADYAPGGGGGFPVLQAAPLAQLGSAKGGPFSAGCFGYRLALNAQFGELRISHTADGDASGPCVEFRGFRAGAKGDREVLRWRKCGRLSAVRGVGGDDKRCALPLLPAWMWVVLVVIVLWVCSMVASLGMAWCVWRQSRDEGVDDDSRTDKAGLVGDGRERREDY